MADSNKGTAVAIAAIVALVLGGGVGYAVGMNDTGDNGNTNSSMNSSAPTAAVSSKAADLRATLVSLGTEHQDLTYTAVSSALAAAPSAEADAADLFKNGKDLSDAVGSVYGEEAGATFNSVWDVHLNEFVNYAVASSQMDEAAKAQALATIDADYTKPLAAYLAKANPNLPEDALYSGLNEHVKMTAVIIDAQAAGDYAKATAERDSAVKHLEGLMSTLSAGIVKQFPEKF